MIRPRCGDFVYTQDEIEVMILDIRSFKALGIAGVVVGVLTPDGDVDVQYTNQSVPDVRIYLILMSCFKARTGGPSITRLATVVCQCQS
jgi:hypothetical protein